MYLVTVTLYFFFFFPMRSLYSVLFHFSFLTLVLFLEQIGREGTAVIFFNFLGGRGCCFFSKHVASSLLLFKITLVSDVLAIAEVACV